MKKATGQNTTKNTVTKRIFYPNKYYLFDKDNKCLKIVSNPKELEDIPFEDTDTILIGVHPDKMFPDKKKLVNKIVLDFDKKELTIEGGNCVIAKVEYEGGGAYTLDDADLEDWENMMKDCRKLTKDFTIVGNPPIKGELLYV